MTKPLIPSMRERNRYLVFEIISESRFTRDDILKSFWREVIQFLGEKGTSETSFWILDWDDEKQKGILKMNHKSVDDIRAALTLLKQINKEKIIFHALGVSGTLKKARNKYF